MSKIWGAFLAGGVAFVVIGGLISDDGGYITNDRPDEIGGAIFLILGIVAIAWSVVLGVVRLIDKRREHR